MMDWVNSVVLTLIFLFEGVMGGQYCETFEYTFSTRIYTTTYCNYGCCYSACCPVAVVVVPCVIGPIIIIAVIIVCICCYRQCGQKKGMVASPQGQSNQPYAQQAYNQQTPVYYQVHYMNTPGVQPVTPLLQPPVQQHNSQAHYPGPPVYFVSASNQQQFPPMSQPAYDARGSQLPPLPPAYSTSSAPPPPYSY